MLKTYGPSIFPDLPPHAIEALALGQDGIELRVDQLPAAPPDGCPMM